MRERALTTPGQDGGPQTRWLCGDDNACLETTSPDAPAQSHRFDRHTAPAPICPFRLVESTMGLNNTGVAALHAKHVI